MRDQGEFHDNIRRCNHLPAVDPEGHRDLLNASEDTLDMLEAMQQNRLAGQLQPPEPAGEIRYQD